MANNVREYFCEQPESKQRAKNQTRTGLNARWRVNFNKNTARRVL